MSLQKQNGGAGRSGKSSASAAKPTASSVHRKAHRTSGREVNANPQNGIAAAANKSGARARIVGVLTDSRTISTEAGAVGLRLLVRSDDKIPIPVSVWDKALIAAALHLLTGDRIKVRADIKASPWMARNGEMSGLKLRLTATRIDRIAAEDDGE